MASIASLVVKIGAQDAEIQKALAGLGVSAKRVDADFKKLGDTPIAKQAQKSFEDLKVSIKSITDAQQGLADRSQLAAKGLEALGGPARLTRTELDQMAKTLERGLDAFRALGQQAPRELQKIGAAVQAQQTALSNLAKPGLLNQVGAQIASTAAGFVTGQAILGTIHSIFEAFVQATKGSVEFASHLDDLSKSTNINVEALQELGFAGKRVGLDLDTIATVIGQLAKRVGVGDEGATGALQAMGLSIRDLRGLAPDELFQVVAETAARIQDPIQQAAIGSQLFGKQFQAAIRLANDGLTETRHAAREAGAVLGEEAVKKLDAFGDKVGDITVVLKVLAAQALTPVVEGLQSLLLVAQNVAKTPIKFFDKGQQGEFENQQKAFHLLITDFERFQQLKANQTGQAVGPVVPTAGSLANLSGLGKPIEITGDAAKALSAGQALITNADLITNRLTALRTAALEPLTAAQREQIAQLHTWGESEKTIADLIGASQQAVHRYLEALAKAQEAEKKFAEAMVEITAASGGFGEIIAGIGGNTAEAVQFFLRAGVSQSALGTAFGLSAVEVKALATQLELLTKLTDLNVGATIGLADGLGQFGRAEVELLPQLKARLEVMDKLQKLEQVKPGHITIEGLPGADLESIGRLKEQLEQLKQFSKALDTLAQAFAQLSQVSGNAFGELARDIGIAINAISLAEKAMQEFAAATNFAGKQAALMRAAALVSAGGALAAATSTPSRTANIAGGAVTGAFIGAEAGAALGAKAGSPAGWWGIVAGAIAGGIIGWLRSRSEWRQLQKQIGHDLGVGISDELAKALEADSKRFGRQVTESLHLDRIIEEAGGVKTFGIEKATAKLHDLFTFLDEGKLTVGQVGDEFDKVFAQLIPQAIEKGTGLASKGLIDLVQQARAHLIDSPALTQFITDQLSNVITGLQAGLKTGPLAGQGAASAFGAAIASVFAGLQERGVPILQIFKQLEPLIVQLQAKLKAAGLAGGEVFDQIARLGKIVTQFAPLLDGIDGIRLALAGLANTGLLTQQTFEGLATQVEATFQKLIHQGVSADDALTLMQPTLQLLWELEKDFGLSVDAATQALIDQAVAQGKVGEAFRSPQQQMQKALENIVVILAAIAKQFGVTLPAAVQAYIDALNKIPKPGDTNRPPPHIPQPGDPDFPDHFPRPGDPDFPWPFSHGGLVTPHGAQHFAGGGRVLPFLRRGSDTVPAMLTPGEVVLTRDQQQEIAARLGGGAPVVNVDARGSWFDGRGVEELTKRITQELSTGSSFSKFQNLVRRAG